MKHKATRTVGVLGEGEPAHGAILGLLLEGHALRLQHRARALPLLVGRLVGWLVGWCMYVLHFTRLHKKTRVHVKK